MKKLETYFSRHTWKCSIDEKTRDRMWKDQRIFIHFPWDKSGNTRSDSRSINPDDYEGFRKGAISALKNLAREGGYVAAHYVEHPKWMMGFVKPQKIKLVRGQRRSDYPYKPPKYHNGIEIIKTLRLSKCRWIAPADYALLQAVQPRQGTIMRWHKAGGLVEAIVLGKKPKISFDLLSPLHQEILCAEFLRRRIALRFGLPQLDCILCALGRSMKDLDIFGLATDGRKIFAQVTHDSLKKVEHKIKALKKYWKGGSGHLILFCNHEKLEIRDGVTIVPIKEVFRIFTTTPTGKRWLRGVFQKV